MIKMTGTRKKKKKKDKVVEGRRGRDDEGDGNED